MSSHEQLSNKDAKGNDIMWSEVKQDFTLGKKCIENKTVGQYIKQCSLVALVSAHVMVLLGVDFFMCKYVNKRTFLKGMTCDLKYQGTEVYWTMKQCSLVSLGSAHFMSN